MDRFRKRHIALIILMGILMAAAVFYFNSDDRQDTAFIRDYDPDKDFVALVNLINANMFWLSENPDFSAEKFLSMRAPNWDPSRKGQTTISVLEAGGSTAGFVSFHKKGPTHGYIWLLAVDQNFRRRGFGEMLLNHALNQLKKQGAQYVTLTTRMAKTPAISLYQKAGFVEQGREVDRGILTLIKRNL